MSNLTARFAELIDRNDLDELSREIDRLCHDRQWGGLLQLRDQCRRAVQRGRQMWPAAAYAEYRLALEAPGPWAARMLEPGAGRFTLGPLSEVAAARHSWDELAEHAPLGPVATMAAHERVLRGEDLREDSHVDRAVLELPLVLQLWEPSYPLADYQPHRAEFPTPPLPRLQQVDLPSAQPVRVDDRETARALIELAQAWTTESNGRAEAVGVSGTAHHAVAALGPRRARMAELEASEAMAVMAWTAASGGAHGRRRGMAAGRFGAWWAVAALADLLDAWPLPGEELGQAAAGLRWFAWDAGEPETGWTLHLAVEDPAQGVSWAVTATDMA